MAKSKGNGKRKTRTAWSEGDGVPDAAIVETAHVEGITYQRKFISCGKDRCRKGCASGVPSHGPYWYATYRSKGKVASSYVGKELPRIDQLANRPEKNP